MQAIEKIYEEIGKKHGISTKAVQRDICHALKIGAASLDAEVQDTWADIPFSRKKPTPKEVIQFCSEECLRRYKQK